MLGALFQLARPRGILLFAFLPVIGFTFAFWDHSCWVPELRAVRPLLELILLWSMLHSATMWLNAALDRDEGAVLFGRSTKVPPGIEKYGYGLLVITVALAFAIDLGVALCISLCAALSVLYSHPRTAWKGHPFFGPFTNGLGYGVLSPLGGFLYAHVPPSPRGATVLVVSVVFIMTAYFAAQAFQHEEDSARGYRTLVATHGPRTTLRVTRALLAASTLSTLALAAVGYFPRAVLVAAPAFWWADRLMAQWAEQPGGGDASWAYKLFWRMTVAGLLCITSVCVDYALADRAGRIPGGLDTASGHPPVAGCGDLGIVPEPGEGPPW